MLDNKDKIILSLCDYSGNWPRPYAEAGYCVIYFDIAKSGLDIRLLTPINMGGKVHGILAAPPCTEFASSGARWWKQKGVAPLLENLSIVDSCYRIVMINKPKWWALENPVGRLKNYLGPPVYRFDPCDFGDPYTKRTLLWGEFNPPIKNPVPPTQGSKMHLVPGSKNQARIRSETPEGFARAFFAANP